MGRILLFIFLAYILYKVVFHFIIPIYRTTKQVKKGFREMQEKMQEQMRQQQGFQNASAPPQKQDKPVGEYIDFEDVK
jgi:hypothetical protein